MRYVRRDKRVQLTEFKKVQVKIALGEIKIIGNLEFKQ